MAMKLSVERRDAIILDDVCTVDDIESLSIGVFPRMPEDVLYPTAKGCFKLMINQPDRTIKTIESIIDLPSEKTTIQLLDRQFIANYKLKNDYLHVGFVQVKIIPNCGPSTDYIVAGRLGALRLCDAGGSSPQGHTLASMNPNFFEGRWLYFHCFPNLTVSLNDPQVLRALLLLVDHRQSFTAGCRPIRVECAVRCKLMKKGSDARVLTEICKGTMEFLQGLPASYSLTVIRMTHQWEVFEGDELHQKQAASTSPGESTKN